MIRRSFFAALAGMFGAVAVIAAKSKPAHSPPTCFRYDGKEWVAVSEADAQPGDTIALVSGDRLQAAVIQKFPNGEILMSRPVQLIPQVRSIPQEAPK